MPASDALSAAIYARVSSEQQAQQQTITSQVEALRQRVRQDGLTLPEELCFLDEGASGSTLLRPALERLRDQAAAEYERRRHGKGREDRPVEQLQAQIAKAKRGVARLIDAYEDGLLERSEFEPRLRRAKGRLEKLEAEAAALMAAAAEEQHVEAVLGQLQEFAHRVAEGLAEASWPTRREIIRALVKRVEIDAEEVRVVYKVPPHPFAEAPEGGCLQDRFGRDFSSAGQYRSEQPRLATPRARPALRALRR